MKKRDFLRLSGMFAAGALAAPALTFCQSQSSSGAEKDKEENELPESMIFELLPLPYAIDALEPNIDARTMEIHHGKHHAGYTKNLNAEIEKHGNFSGKEIEEILASLGDDEKHTALRNNAGGYYNHNHFWKVMHPNGGGAPRGAVAEAIQASFGGYDTFKEDFAKAAASVFGSGWAWLCAKDGNLYITTTPNQDNPLMKSLAEKPGTPLLGIDVWEHAYYLNYQNRRADYIQGFFNVINWDEVNANLDKI